MHRKAHLKLNKTPQHSNRKGRSLKKQISKRKAFQSGKVINKKKGGDITDSESWKSHDNNSPFGPVEGATKTKRHK